MSTQPTLASTLGQAVRSDWSALRKERISAWSALSDIRGLVAVWRERRYYRRELKRLAKDGPQLIDDIGLTMRVVETEIEKPFWQA